MGKFVMNLKADRNIWCADMSQNVTTVSEILNFTRLAFFRQQTLQICLCNNCKNMFDEQFTDFFFRGGSLRNVVKSRQLDELINKLSRR